MRHLRHLVAAVATAGALVASSSGVASAAPAPQAKLEKGIVSITPITQVYTYGQKVTAVAIEYSVAVDPRTLDKGTFTVSDSIYNFRFNPIEDLAKRADRTVTRIYTNEAPTLNADGGSDRGRYVIVELDAADAGGNTVIVSKCPTFMCTVKVNPDLPTKIKQNEKVYAKTGKKSRGPVLGNAFKAQRAMTAPAVNLLADEFVEDTYLKGGIVLPYSYHLPADYDPERSYPMVVILPGHGMGWDGANLGVQVAADIPATAWLQSSWTGTDEDVIVLAPQNQRVGGAAEAATMVALVRDFMGTHAVDPGRVYASTVSYGSQLAWQALSTDPGLFAGALITGGFQVSEEQATKIAADRTPIWVTHGTNDHLLKVSFGQTSTALLRSAYVASGLSQAEAEGLVRYTEYGNESFSQPDYHAAYGPTYEDSSILQWLLAQGE